MKSTSSAPAVGGGLEEGDERRGRGEEHAVADTAVDDGGIGFEGGGEDGGVGGGFAHATVRVARARDEPQHGEAEQAGQEADEGGETEQQVAGRRERGHGRARTQ